MEIIIQEIKMVMLMGTRTKETIMVTKMVYKILGTKMVMETEMVINIV